MAVLLESFQRHVLLAAELCQFRIRHAVSPDWARALAAAADIDSGSRSDPNAGPAGRSIGYLRFVVRWRRQRLRRGRRALWRAGPAEPGPRGPHGPSEFAGV